MQNDTYECPCGYLAKGEVCSKCRISKRASTMAEQFYDLLMSAGEGNHVPFRALPKPVRAVFMKTASDTLDAEIPRGEDGDKVDG